MEATSPLSLKRKFYQIYAEFSNISFDGETKTIPTLRAKILEELAFFKFKEYIPHKKQSCNRFEDVIKLREPEAEIKFGLGFENTLYVQVSCINADSIDAYFDVFKGILETWQKGE